MGTPSTANIPHPDLEKELMCSTPTDFTGDGISNAPLTKVLYIVCSHGNCALCQVLPQDGVAAARSRLSGPAVGRISFSRSARGHGWDLLGSALPTSLCITQGYQKVLSDTRTALRLSTPSPRVSRLSLGANASVKVPQIQQSHVAQALFAVIAAFKWKIDIIAVLSQHTAVCTFVQCSLRTISIHWHRKVTDAVCK